MNHRPMQPQQMIRDESCQFNSDAFSAGIGNPFGRSNKIYGSEFLPPMAHRNGNRDNGIEKLNQFGFHKDGKTNEMDEFAFVEKANRYEVYRRGCNS
ncbi:hypothetical protein TNCV_3669871 [Trichonephila clavipes]|nr:hypothetical protein TNCV_3669871 [Trichonephila clavipes]